MSEKGVAEQPSESPVSLATYLGISASVFSLSLIYGGYRAAKSSKEHEGGRSVGPTPGNSATVSKFSIKSWSPLKAFAKNQAAFGLAARAFGIATALCFGTFSAAGSLFMYANDLHSLEDIDVFCRVRMGQSGVGQVLKGKENPVELAEMETWINDNIVVPYSTPAAPAAAPVVSTNISKDQAPAKVVEEGDFWTKLDARIERRWQQLQQQLGRTPTTNPSNPKPKQ